LGFIRGQQRPAAPGKAFGFAKMQVRDAKKPGIRPKQRARWQGVQGSIGKGKDMGHGVGVP
jgi:hypothetical protein